MMWWCSTTNGDAESFKFKESLGHSLDKLIIDALVGATPIHELCYALIFLTRHVYSTVPDTVKAVSTNSMKTPAENWYTREIGKSTCIIVKRSSHPYLYVSQYLKAHLYCVHFLGSLQYAYQISIIMWDRVRRIIQWPVKRNCYCKQNPTVVNTPPKCIHACLRQVYT